MKKNLLLTFDYELFLGPRSGQPIESIIEPTERIRKVINPKGIKAIFFVDTTYLITLEKFSNQHNACAADLKIVSDQIKQLISDGHYIFPHIHPHWLDAEYDSLQHQFNLSEVKKCIEKISKNITHLDKIILNAGVCSYLDMPNFDAEIIHENFSVNFLFFDLSFSFLVLTLSLILLLSLSILGFFSSFYLVLL